jgi:16S rRNA (cytosine967-C5)-methyltransferase
VTTARGVAAEVLSRVTKDQAFAAAALDAELSRAMQMSARDRALATELVYGSLRVLPWLRGRIERHAKKAIEPRVLSHLVVAAYQLFFLDRVPAFAAVDAGVEEVRRLRGPRVGAFANAVLRKLATEAEAERGGGRLREDATLASAAPWLVEALSRALGEEEARAFLMAGVEAPPLSLRVENAGERDAWIARLREASPDGTFEAGKVSPLAIVLRGAGKPQELAGYRDGAFTVQEEGSQLVALALGVRAGERVLDACAGRGNKTAILARAVGAEGAVEAADLHESKLARLEQDLARVGLAARALHAVDWTVGAGDVEGTFDRVLVDAPCSGVGTLRRRPELQTRRAPEDLAALSALQRAIAARASERVRPGGRFVYAVCSVLREEAEDVVSTLPGLRPAPFDADAARALAGDAPTLRLLPQKSGTDGYFVASFVKG